ncbi:hypothetical protein B0A48_06835 [Cryoendolithus antarcticus]|uniref:Nucleoporin NUP37 n=1 Tax=Cryoendolithus antarcticus TaxID=1507870 RepID=A0A1V8TA29_9PEZI|nr:hypothetical protein B0A48_06835 [Cryoendolithus antarcticus]
MAPRYDRDEASSSLSKPKVTKRERKIQLTYDLPHRIRCAAIYPVSAPNGSTVILYGHDRGLRVLWRGGRRIKAASRPPPPANNANDVIMIDDSDDEPAAPPPAPTVEFENDEEELDEETPYQSIVQEMDIVLGSPVLHLAIPSLPPDAKQRLELKDTIVVTIYTSNGEVSLLKIPLAPPRDSQESGRTLADRRFRMQAGKTLVRGLAMKLVPHGSETTSSSNRNAPSEELLIAAVSDALFLWRVPIQYERFKLSRATQQTVPLLHRAVSLSFLPSASSVKLLLTDVSGTARIYDPLALVNLPEGFTGAILPSDIGTWVFAYHAPYHSSPSGSGTAIGPLARKKLLATACVLEGRAIFALLEDGQWGMWDSSGATQSTKKINDFAVDGYLTTAPTAESQNTLQPRKALSKLNPMTPNTRKLKSEALFTGPTATPGNVARGGISVSSTNTANGQAVESVVLWFNGDLYTIPNMQQFWQRSTNATNAAGTGTLGNSHAPGLTHMPSIPLLNESITSISQFLPSSASNSLGQMNTTRDLLLSAEHRFIIQQSTATPAGKQGVGRQLFASQANAAAAPVTKERDRKLLGTGDLDLNGVDRMLDSMARDDRPRKVGFAA